MMSYIPERGDVIWIDFDPQAGHEQAGRRPALVLSVSSYNCMRNLALVCPITSKIKTWAFEVLIPPGMQIHGVVLSDQIKNMDWKVRKSKFICTLPPQVVDEVLAKASALLK